MGVLVVARVKVYGTAVSLTLLKLLLKLLKLLIYDIPVF
jgi:hypothetical protein